MVATNSFQYKFLKKKKINLLREYLNNHWKKNHILSLSKRLLIWQHQKNNDEINFFVCLKNENIIGILGIINFYDTKYKDSKIGLSTWCIQEKYRNLGGIILLKFLKKFKDQAIVATGLNKISIKYYKFFNFNITKFNKFYICPTPKNKQKISKNLSLSIPSLEKYIKKDKFENLYKYINNYYKKNYFKKRFEEHPFYDHFVLRDIRYNIWFIVREVKIKKYKFLRILDYFGEFKDINLEKSLSRFCKDYNFHHIEFLYYGIEKKNIIKAGFNLINDKKNILPILTEPYLGLHNSNILIAFKNLNKVSIVKGDVDADRPNQI